MIKIAFVGTYSKKWMGGINYMSNLLYAISKLEDKKIEAIVFLGKKADEEIVQKFQPHAKIVQDSLFDRKSFKWFISKILEKIFNITPLIDHLLNKYEISVISHSGVLNGYNNFIKINWIPDFQHMHLPDFFSRKENKKRDIIYLKILQKSDCIIVSSNDAYNDCRTKAPELIDKVRVLQFVSQPNPKVFTLNKAHLTHLEKKYDFRGKFFYIPNQFWKHKNHMLIFQAVKMLKDTGIEVLILCSGYMQDNRNPAYIEEVKTFIDNNKLEDNIKLMGLINYDDVLYFMRYSIAVINPSLFEGWSSTVEECKSIGKNMLLSDIPVHREQNPEESIYFDPNNVENVAEILKKVWLDARLVSPNKNLEMQAKNSLRKRTLTFAEIYQNIVLKTIQGLHR